jgi:DNA segregation ATPase FtsK/SpoIIIE-like protein
MADLKSYIHDIAELVYQENLTSKTIENVIANYGIKSIKDIKLDLIDLLILYISIVLEDFIITENEKKNVSILKRLFKIKEGDFYNNRLSEIERILHIQFYKLYVEEIISEDESVYSFEMQDLFDLGFDQFEAIKRKELCKMDLTQFEKIKKYNIIEDEDYYYVVEAAKIIVRNKLGSISLIQRELKLEYEKANFIMSKLEKLGIVGKFHGLMSRDVKIETLEELQKIFPEIELCA